MDGIAVAETKAMKCRRMTSTRRGMETDLERAAMVLLAEYREGRLRRISLETRQSRAPMLAAAAGGKL